MITKLMVSVRDVTEIRSMQAAAEEQRRELEMVGQILRITPAKFSQFADNALHMLEQNETIIRQQAEKDLSTIATLFANMHTIKGNARTYQLSFITDVVHEAESVYDRLRKESESRWDSKSLLEDLQHVREALLRYRRVQDDKLSFVECGNASRKDGIVIDRLEYKSLLNACEALAKNTDFSSHGALLSLVRGLDVAPLPVVLEGLLRSLPEVANQLGKPAPIITIDDKNLEIYNDHSNMVINVFSHLLKNALDHGIEPPIERLSKGKSERGCAWAPRSGVPAAEGSEWHDLLCD